MQKIHAINVENSINSGQVFLWRENEEYWYGVNGQDILKINTLGEIKSFQKKNTDFFRKRDDIEQIIKSISKDKTVKNAVRKYLGLRLLKQDPFQCMISFIVSSNSNIQNIQNSLKKICQNDLGEKTKFDKKEFFLFPDSPQEIS